MWWILYACWYYHHYYCYYFGVYISVKIQLACDFLRIFMNAKKREETEFFFFIISIIVLLFSTFSHFSTIRIFFSWSTKWRNWCVLSCTQHVCWYACRKYLFIQFAYIIYTIFLGMLINFRILLSIYYSKQHTNNFRNKKKSNKISTKQKEMKRKEKQTENCLKHFVVTEVNFVRGQN